MAAPVDRVLTRIGAGIKALQLPAIEKISEEQSGTPFEVLIATSAISNLIREGKTFQIPSMMQVGKGVGMVTLNDALLELVTKKLVAPEEAWSKAVDKTAFENALKRVGADTRAIPTAQGKPA